LAAASNTDADANTDAGANTDANANADADADADASAEQLYESRSVQVDRWRHLRQRQLAAARNASAESGTGGAASDANADANANANADTDADATGHWRVHDARPLRFTRRRHVREWWLAATGDDAARSVTSGADHANFARQAAG
jgi:hypothetical protein